MVAVAATALASGIAWAAVPASPAGPTRDTASTVNYVVKYSGLLEGSWGISTPKGTKCGAPSEQSGSFTSSVRPGSKPFKVAVSEEFEGRLYLKFGMGQGNTKGGVVTHKQSSEGWRTKGDCYPDVNPFGHIPIDNSGCGSKTFAASVGFYPVGGSYLHAINKVYLSWPFQLPLACTIGVKVWSTDVEVPQESVARPLDLEKLYACGKRKPRGCKLTLSGSKNYSYRDEQKGVGYPDREGLTTYTGKSHVEWSITFVAVGLSG
jgi:hypothetical protein